MGLSYDVKIAEAGIFMPFGVRFFLKTGVMKVYNLIENILSPQPECLILTTEEMEDFDNGYIYESRVLNVEQ